ncbi:MAG: beta-ketoacyl-ACP synthase III [Alphaproteobacteria bacterium]|nr:beta-ketoacyl-ACP synthase III [Alphaproteobacteria bacterium]
MLHDAPSAVIAGTGSYLPVKVMTNADMAKIVDTNDEWIVARTGIKARHIADSEYETTSFMASEAAKKALEAAQLKPEDIDAIIVATTTPDLTFPSVAAQVQAMLGVPPCVAFDVQAVCSGFLYALSVADKFIKTKSAENILVIGAERMSKILDWNDRTTCVLFGDGAGAVVLKAHGDTKRGVIATNLYADGRLKDILLTSGGTATTGDAGMIQMQGKDVFKYAVTFMAEMVDDILKQADVKREEINWLVPHQANLRIISGAAQKLGLPMEQVIITLDSHGNTSAASIPLALDQGVRDGRIKQGQMLLMEAVGGGLTWASALVRY